MKIPALGGPTKLALLIAAMTVSSLPALCGGWVYDDRLTASSEAQDGLDDLLAVFARDSAAYLGKENDSAYGVTYRPLSMASLIAVQALGSDLAWLHHLVSWALHSACVVGLYIACRRAISDPQSQRPGLIAALFALHPVGVEAYGWINGRSDVLAGAFLALLACVVLTPRPAEERALRAALALVSGAGAAFSKEPALVAVLVLLAVGLLPTAGLPTRASVRAGWPVALAGALGLCGAALARWHVTRGSVSGAAHLLSDPELVPGYAQVLALAVEHLLLPLPRTMLYLGFELARPMRLADWACAAATLLGSIVLLQRGQLRALLLLAGALSTLLPVLAVKQLLWLGFDRYLYIPALLLGLSCATFVPGSPVTARRSRAYWLLVLPLLALCSYWTAKPYADHDAWLKSLIVSRPDDPSGYVLAAQRFIEANDLDNARSIVRRAPLDNVPPAASHELVDQLKTLGLLAEANGLSQLSYAHHPEHPLVLLDALTACAADERFDEVLQIGRKLERSYPRQCKRAVEALEEWLRTPRGQQERIRPKVEHILGQLHCAREEPATR